MWYLRIFLSCLNKVLGSRQEAIPVVGQQDTEEGAVGGLELVTGDTGTIYDAASIVDNLTHVPTECDSASLIDNLTYVPSDYDINSESEFEVV